MVSQKENQIYGILLILAIIIIVSMVFGFDYEHLRVYKENQELKEQCFDVYQFGEGNYVLNKELLYESMKERLESKCSGKIILNNNTILFLDCEVKT